MTEVDEGNIGLGLISDQKLQLTKDLQVDLLAIVHSYQKTKPGVFQKHIDRLLDEVNANNSDGSLNKEKKIIWSWGGMSGDGTSFGILSTIRYLFWRRQIKHTRPFHITYHNFIEDLIIARKLGWVHSPQGQISYDEYQKTAQISAELRDLFLTHLPYGRSSGQPLLHIEDNCTETEIYYEGEVVGSPRGNTKDLRRLIANRWPVFKVSINAPETVNLQSMNLREIVPQLPNSKVDQFLKMRGIIDDRYPKEIKKSYLLCGNRDTLLQQYRDIVDNSRFLIRKQKGFFENITLDIGEFDYILSEGSQIWVDKMTDPDLRERWDSFLDLYYQVHHRLLYGSERSYWAISLTPEKLPASIYRLENRDWFNEHRAITELINCANRTEGGILVSRLKDLRLIPNTKRIFTL